MQIVIDIPEWLYQDIQEYLHPSPLDKVIQNGIPLPKGHGRLIDADAFIKNESCCGYIEDMDIDYFKQHTPTIIEAEEEKQ